MIHVSVHALYPRYATLILQYHRNVFNLSVVVLTDSEPIAMLEFESAFLNTLQFAQSR